MSGFGSSFRSSLSLYDDQDFDLEKQETDFLFKIVLKKMKKTLSLSNDYITVGTQFMVSLLNKVDFTPDLLNFINTYEEQNPEISNSNKGKKKF